MNTGDFVSFVAAIWMFYESSRSLHRMSKATAWIPYLQNIGVCGSSLGLILSYAQEYLPSVHVSHWLNVNDMQGLLIGSMVVAMVVDRRTNPVRDVWSAYKRAAVQAKTDWINQ